VYETDTNGNGETAAAAATEGYADTIVETVGMLERFATESAVAADREAIGVYPGDGPDGEGVDLMAAMESTALEVVTITEQPWSGAPATVAGVRVVFTVGGPYAAATYREAGGDGYADIVVYWGTETARRTVRAPRTAAYLHAVAEEWS